MVPRQTDRVIDRDGHVVVEGPGGIDLDEDIAAVTRDRPGAMSGDRVPSPGSGAALRGALPAWLAANGALALAIGHAYLASSGVQPTWDAGLYAHLAFAAPVLVVMLLLGADAQR